jgi:hypothetical protein
VILVTLSGIPGRQPFEPYKGLTTRWHMTEFLRAVSGQTFAKVTEEDVRAGRFDSRIWGWLFPEAPDADPDVALAFLEDPTIPCGAGRCALTCRNMGQARHEVGYFDAWTEDDTKVWEPICVHATAEDAAMTMLRLWQEARR